jgi:hypothetical protein
LENELSLLKEQHENLRFVEQFDCFRYFVLMLSAECTQLRHAMNQMNATHRVEMDSAQGVVNILKARLEQKIEESKKFENIISGTNVLMVFLADL